MEYCVLWGDWVNSSLVSHAVGSVLEQCLASSELVLTPHRWYKARKGIRELGRGSQSGRICTHIYTHLDTHPEKALHSEMYTYWGDRGPEAEAHRPAVMGQYTDTDGHTTNTNSQREGPVGRRKKSCWGEEERIREKESKRMVEKKTMRTIDTGIHTPWVALEGGRESGGGWADERNNINWIALFALLLAVFKKCWQARGSATQNLTLIASWQRWISREVTASSAMSRWLLRNRNSTLTRQS